MTTVPSTNERGLVHGETVAILGMITSCFPHEVEVALIASDGTQKFVVVDDDRVVRPIATQMEVLAKRLREEADEMIERARSAGTAPNVIEATVIHQLRNTAGLIEEVLAG